MKAKQWVMIGALASLSVALPLNAYAMGGMGSGSQMGSGGNMGSGGQMGPGHMGSDVDWACPNNCADNANTCRLAAQEGERLCTQTACSQQTQDMNSACDAAPRSAACRRAQLVQRQCLQQTCMQPYTTDLRGCRDEQLTCLQNCPPAADLFSKAPQCVEPCEASFTGCLNTADAAAQTCRTACSDPVSAAQHACQASDTSDACQQALRAVHACLEPCDDGLHLDRRACISAAQDCVAACPDATPAP